MCHNTQRHAAAQQLRALPSPHLHREAVCWTRHPPTWKRGESGKPPTPPIAQHQQLLTHAAPALPALYRTQRVNKRSPIYRVMLRESGPTAKHAKEFPEAVHGV